MKDSNNGDAEALRKHAREDMQDSLDEELEMELDDHRMEEILATDLGGAPMESSAIRGITLGITLSAWILTRLYPREHVIDQFD